MREIMKRIKEALAKAQGARRAYEDRTFAEMATAHEQATGNRGEWSVRCNESYDSFFEGDRGGFLWIVTYTASPPRIDQDVAAGQRSPVVAGSD